MILANTRVEFDLYTHDFRSLATWLLNDVFLRNCRHRVVRLTSVFVQNIVDISYCVIVRVRVVLKRTVVGD